MPVVEAKAVEPAAEFMLRVSRIEVLHCQRCKVGRLVAVQAFPGRSRLPAPADRVVRWPCQRSP